MKKLLFALLILTAAKAGAQCPEYLGYTIDSVKSIVSAAHTYLQFDLVNSNPESEHDILYRDSVGFCTVRFRVGHGTKLEGTKLVDLPPAINGIFISGPADRIDKMYSEYFLPKVKQCDKYNQTQIAVMYNNVLILVNTTTSFKEIPIKKLSITPR